MHIISMGILLGLGAAVPIGPVNVEIAKRNLNWGTSVGLALGFGACTVDLLYLILLAQGILMILNKPIVLGSLGVLGSCVLLYFVSLAFKAPNHSKSQLKASKAGLIRHWFDGFLMTITNPYTIIFWGSVGTQWGMINQGSEGNLIPMGIGLLIGTIAWILFLNFCLRITRKRISDRLQHFLNITGGWIILLIALLGFYRSFHLLTSL